MTKHTIEIQNKLFLAPLAGISDRAFRTVCKDFGADITVTEMISAKGLYYKDKKTEILYSFGEYETPIGIQLFGSDPDIIEYAVKTVSELSPQFIDINMGCPVPKIVNNGEGSFLMTKPELVYKIINKAALATSLPISAKIRAGFDNDRKNAVEIAKTAEDAGASFITVHGRTKTQMYSSKADYNIIREVKNAVNIPVVGNGDIFSYADAVRMKEETDCDAFMIARGSFGNPFIFEEIKKGFSGESYNPPTDEEKLRTAIYHLKKIIEFKGEAIAVPESRKHMAWYLKGMKNSAEVKNKLFTAKSFEEIEKILTDFNQNKANF